MADDLRRVGLVFTQEGAVDFKKSLQEVNLELNKNYNQFKLTQAQWDKSTTSTQKLRAEQEYLKNAYEIQTDKVNTLKMQLADLENAENKNTSAIKKKRNELTNAEVKLETYNKRLKEIDNQLNNTGKKIEEFGTKAENVGNKMEKAGKKLSAFSVATGSALVASAKSAIDFEDSFTGVEKTVDGTEEQMAELKQGIRDMAKEIPSTTTEISAVAEAAGQLGIKTDDILSFTKVMIDLGNSTNLSAEEAASSLAKFANITKMSAKDYDKLGSTIVALGNNFATTEADIVEMATRLAATGELAGLSQSQILSLATAMSSVGIEAEAGGSAMSKLLKRIQVACETSSDDLKDFAKVAGMSVDDFKKAFEKDAVSALTSFISGLNDTERNGKSAISILDDMEIKEVRLSNTILSLANASDLMNEAVELGNEAWEDNTALTNEANKRYDTLKSKIQIAWNKIKDLAITLGNKLMPTLETVIDKIGDFTKWVENLTDEQVEWILKIGAAVTALGPLLTIIGNITSVAGGAIKGIGIFTQAIGVMTGKITTSSTAVNGLAKVIGTIATPTGLAIVGITGLVAGIVALEKATYESSKKTEESIERATEQIDKLNEQKQATEELKKAQEEYLDTNLSEIEYVSQLRNELTTLVDENGKVKDSYKGRVQFILGELNEALGTEYKMNDNVIQGYKELSKSIDETIAKKKANIILNSKEEEYTNAIKSRSDAIKNLAELEETYYSDKQKLSEKQLELAKLEQEKGGLTHIWKINNLQKEIETLKENTTAYEEQKDKVIEYNQTIIDYENLSATIQEGNLEKIEEINSDYTNSYRNRKDETIEALEEQIRYESANLETQKETYIRNQSEITKKQIEESEKRLETLAEELTSSTNTIGDLSTEQIDAWKALAIGSYDTYYDAISKMPKSLSNKIQEMTGVTAEKTPELVEETQKMSQQVIDEIDKNSEFKKKATSNLQGFLQGLEDDDLRELLKEAGVEDAEKVMKGIKKGNLAEDEGTEILKSLNTGLKNRTWKDSLFSTARRIASSLSGLLSVKASVNGTTSSIPGHKLGLDYVPKDNYVARLHKGERVLTKEENESYTEAEERNKRSSNKSSVFSSEINYDKMANAMARALTSCKFTLDEDGFAKIVKDELYKVV